MIIDDPSFTGTWSALQVLGNCWRPRIHSYEPPSKDVKSNCLPLVQKYALLLFGGGPIVLLKSSLNNTKTQQICFSSRFPKSVSSKISKISCSLLFARIGHFSSRCLSGILEKNANGISWVYPSSGVPFSTKVIAWLLLGLLFFRMPWWSRKRHINRNPDVLRMALPPVKSLTDPILMASNVVVWQGSIAQAISTACLGPRKTCTLDFAS